MGPSVLLCGCVNHKNIRFTFKEPSCLLRTSAGDEGRNGFLLDYVLHFPSLLQFSPLKMRFSHVAKGQDSPKLFYTQSSHYFVMSGCHVLVSFLLHCLYYKSWTLIAYTKISLVAKESLNSRWNGPVHTKTRLKADMLAGLWDCTSIQWCFKINANVNMLT